MATKDEYYQKILASQQSEITSLKTALADMRKELESLKESVAETTEQGRPGTMAAQRAWVEQ